MQGIKSKVKIQYLNELFESEDCVFAIIVESHLKPHHLDAEVELNNCIIIRADRMTRTCGGSCIYVRKDITCYEETRWSNSVIDMCSIKMKNNDTLLINIYRPPDTEAHEFEEALIKLEELLSRNDNNNIIVTGDFNFPTIEWEADDETNIFIKSKTIPKQAEALMELMSEHCLIQCISEPTRGQNVLDLIFTNNQQLINKVTITDTIHSDHKIILCEASRLTKVEKKTNNLHQKFDQLNFFSQNIKWDKLEEQLQSTNWESLLEEKSVTEMYDILTDTTLKISATCVPKRKVTYRSKYKRERRNIWTKIKKAKSYIVKEKRVTHYKNLIKTLEMELVQCYIKENEEMENDAISKIKENPKFFYKYAHKHMKTKSTIGPLCNEAKELTDDDGDMCNLLQKQFSSVFSKPKLKFDPEKFYQPDHANTRTCETSTLKIVVTEEQIIAAIDEMPNSTSSGPDTWPVQILKKCKTQLAKPLTIMWSKSLESGEIPLELLKANVTPIYKKGDKCAPENYRPISLTSLIIKILERIIRKHIIKYLESNRKLNNIQHGFRTGRSCLSQLLSHFDRIINALETGHQYDVIYTDYSKAFDKCDFGIISDKLNKIGVNHNVGRWIYNFLTQRTFSVIVNQTKSPDRNVESSVPQGTVLAPLLFIILINDIDLNIKDCDISTFADDTKIAKIITTALDQVSLQAGLYKLCDWTEDNNMEFNNDKFQIISYSTQQQKHHSSPYYTKEHTQIEEKAEIKDLGVLMANNMSFNSQIIKCVTKAKQKTGWILRTFKSRSRETIMTLYKSLVLPHVDYCSVLVSPYKITEISLLESAQRTITAKITSLKHLNYYERLKTLKLYSLQRRRERLA